MIRRKRADTYVYRLWCDECDKKGLKFQMRAQPLVNMSNPPQYVHKCDNPECDHTETIAGKSYPAVDYVEIEEQVGEKLPTPPTLKPVA